MQSVQLDEWKAIYREVQTREGLDPTVDMDALVVMLWATELGLGMLEAWEVELPQPATWGKLVARLIGSIEPPSGARM